MADDNKIDPSSLFSPVDTTGLKQPANAVKKNDEIGQQQFLNLLVNQLQHQDPLDPMKSEEFAVQLATFSQLEQLIQINKKLPEGSEGAAGTASVSSMASFLGYDVVLKDENVSIAAGKGPKVMLDLPEGVRSARIDFVDEAGKVVGSETVTDAKAGKQLVSLSGLPVPNGTYGMKAVAVDRTGRFVDVTPKVAGTVEGFVLEPEPALLIGGESVSIDNVAEVFKHQDGTSS